MSLFVWLTSLSIIISRPIYVATNGIISLYFRLCNNSIMCIYIYKIFVFLGPHLWHTYFIKYMCTHTHTYIHIDTHATSSLSIHLSFSALWYRSRCEFHTLESHTASRTVIFQLSSYIAFPLLTSFL